MVPATLGPPQLPYKLRSVSFYLFIFFTGPCENRYLYQLSILNILSGQVINDIIKLFQVKSSVFVYSYFECSLTELYAYRSEYIRFRYRIVTFLPFYTFTRVRTFPYLRKDVAAPKNYSDDVIYV